MRGKNSVFLIVVLVVGLFALIAMVQTEKQKPAGRKGERKPEPPITGPPKDGKPVGDRQRQIAFVSDRHGNSEIFVVNADGSKLKRLTTNEAEDSSPTMSPDGKKIAFTSDRDGNSEIYVVNTNGTGLTRLTNSSGNELWPKWSPNGKQIAFWSRDDNQSDIFVMDADGSNSANLTQDNQEDLYPNWMPKGDLIVYLSLRDGGYQFYSISTDGSGLKKLDSGLPPSKHDPSQIMGIFIDADVSSRQIQFFTKKEGIVPFEDPGLALGEFPAWSPDSTKIAFHSNRDGNMEIYVVNEDRSHLNRLTANNAHDMFPCWSPDGKKIAFQSNRDGNLDIYVMNADGSKPIRLTRHAAKDSQPAWCP